MKTFKELMKIDVEATRMRMEAPFVLADGVTGPTRMQVQKAFDNSGRGLSRSSPKPLWRERINQVEKWFKIRDLKVDAKGKVLSYKEEVEIDEKKSATGYELYHKTFSGAMQHAYAHAKSKGFVVDKKEIDDKVATGPKKPSSGKTNRYSLKAGRKKVEIQVANLDNKRYELNMYIEGLELGEMKFEAGKVYHQDTSDGKMYFKAVDQQKNKRWKGLVLDIGQKKPKNGSADEKLRFWKATSDKDIPKALKEEVETRNGPPQIRFMWKRDKRITESDKAKSLAALRTALAVAKYKKAGGKIEKQPPGIARGALKFRGKGEC